MTGSSPLDKGLPVSLEAERLVLGSIILDDKSYELTAGVLAAEDFSLEKHRKIYAAMDELHHRGDPIDRVTLVEELNRRKELEGVGGLSYLLSLDEGLPHIVNLDAYVRIVQEKAVLRRTIFACQAIAKKCLAAEDGSQEILQYAENILTKLGEGQQKHGQWLNPGQVMRSHPGGVSGFLNPPSGGIGIPTPWPPITRILSGLQAGDLFLVAGRPSMGKSIVAMQLAHKASKDGHGVAVFSLEMSKESLVQRLISGVARVDAQRLRTGALNAEERRKALAAASDIDTLPLWIDDTRARTISAITAALRKLRVTQEIRMVVIDHLQLMKGVGRGDEQKRNEQLSDILHSLKHLSGEMALTTLLVSQLNRQCEIENRRPQLSDLKETGTAEEDADEVLFVHRPERYAKNHDRVDLRGVAEFILAKQRNGPTGMKDMVFLKEFQRFDCMAQDLGEGEYQE